MEVLYYPNGTEKTNGIDDLVRGYTINQCIKSNGRVLRGSYSTIEECDDVKPFCFCLDVGAATICGLNIYDFVVGMGNKLGMVLLRECNGNSDVSIAPFMISNNGVSDTEWKNLLKALRRIDFNGTIVIDYYDTMCATPLQLRDDLSRYMRKIGEYLKWQLDMDRTIKKYSQRLLFGAGRMCEDYMYKYGESYPPKYIIDNDRSKWGKTICGVEIIGLHQLIDVGDDIPIFICNMHYNQIESQLKSMGICNPIEYYNDDCTDYFRG